jgi:hypothetical protein
VRVFGDYVHATWNDAQQRIAAAELPTDSYTLVALDLTWRGRGGEPTDDVVRARR